MARKQENSVSFGGVVLIIAIVLGVVYRNDIKIPTNFNIFPSSVQKEVTTAPSLDEIFKTNKADAARIAGILDGVATKAQDGYAAKLIKTNIGLYELSLDGQRIAFGDVKVSTKYPNFVSTYVNWMNVAPAVPNESTPLDDSLVNNFVTKMRELAKSARNASL